jgi:hypothetical protein
MGDEVGQQLVPPIPDVVVKTVDTHLDGRTSPADRPCLATAAAQRSAPTEDRSGPTGNHGDATTHRPPRRSMSRRHNVCSGPLKHALIGVDSLGCSRPRRPSGSTCVGKPTESSARMIEQASARQGLSNASTFGASHERSAGWRLQATCCGDDFSAMPFTDEAFSSPGESDCQRTDLEYVINEWKALASFHGSPDRTSSSAPALPPRGFSDSTDPTSNAGSRGMVRSLCRRCRGELSDQSLWRWLQCRTTCE